MLELNDEKIRILHIAIAFFHNLFAFSNVYIAFVTIICWNPKQSFACHILFLTLWAGLRL